MKKALLSLICVSLLSLTCQRQKVEQSAAVSSSPVTEIRVAGNNRVSSEIIKAQIQTQPGTSLNEAMINADIERLRALGEFDDVQISDDVDANGERILTFHVLEKLPPKTP